MSWSKPTAAEAFSEGATGRRAQALGLSSFHRGIGGVEGQPIIAPILRRWYKSTDLSSYRHEGETPLDQSWQRSPSGSPNAKAGGVPLRAIGVDPDGAHGRSVDGARQVAHAASDDQLGAGGRPWLPKWRPCRCRDGRPKARRRAPWALAMLLASLMPRADSASGMAGVLPCIHPVEASVTWSENSVFASITTRSPGVPPSPARSSAKRGLVASLIRNRAFAPAEPVHHMATARSFCDGSAASSISRMIESARGLLTGQTAPASWHSQGASSARFLLGYCVRG